MSICSVRLRSRFQNAAAYFIAVSTSWLINTGVLSETHQQNPDPRVLGGLSKTHLPSTLARTSSANFRLASPHSTKLRADEGFWRITVAIHVQRCNFEAMLAIRLDRKIE